MNANGRRCKEFKNGFRRFAKICGHSFAGGRPLYSGATTLSVAQSIAKERAAAARLANMKSKKK